MIYEFPLSWILLFNLWIKSDYRVVKLQYFYFDVSTTATIFWTFVLYFVKFERANVF